MKTSAFKVVQVYSGRRGAELLAEASGRLTGGQQCVQSLQTSWNTELLRSAKLRLQAAREAAEADVVILALPEGNELSPELVEWLNLWRRRIRSRRAALVALLRRESLSAERPVEQALEKFAIAASMDFYCHSKVDLALLRCGELPVH